MIAAIVAAATLSAAPDAQARKVLHEMIVTNASVKSYVVRCHLEAAIHAYLPVHLGLNATYYFKQPDKSEVHFDTVPELAKQFKNFYAKTGTPETWPQTYRVTLDPLDPELPGVLLLRLTPKQPSSLAYAIIAVDAQTFGVVQQHWRYADGSKIDVEQQNEMGSFYVLPKHQVADFNFPHYRAHVVADFGDYQLNVPIDDSIFNK